MLLDTLESVTELLEKVLGENEQLREQLAQRGKSSKNSSKPPSSDSPAQRGKRGKRKRSGRSKGAQPGHPKHERALLDPSEVDQTLCHFPPESCGCGAPVAPDDEPHCRHQIADIPEVRHTVTEHQLFGGTCRGCGQRHAAEVPETVPAGQMGPNLIAWIALMGGEMHLSVRQIQRLMLELWDLSFSTGAISQAMGKASAAMARPHGQIVRAARAAPVAHADETRHPRGGGVYPGTWWMWCLATDPGGRLPRALLARHGRGGGASRGLRRGARHRRLRWLQPRAGGAAAVVLGARAPPLRRDRRAGGGGRTDRAASGADRTRVVIRTRHRLDRGEIEERVHHRRMARLRRALRRRARTRDEAARGRTNEGAVRAPAPARADVVDVRDGSAHPADQQPRRTGAASARDLAKALAREPLAARVTSSGRG